MADFCTITTEQAERMGSIVFLAHQLLGDVERALKCPNLPARVARDLAFSARLLRERLPASPSKPDTARAGG